MTQGSATGASDPGAGRTRPDRVRPMWLRVVSGTIVGLLVVVGGIIAVRADGEQVHDVAVTDGRVWVSGGRTGHWGRVNTGAHALDLIVQGAGTSKPKEMAHRPDILQDGRNVIGITKDWEFVAIDGRTRKVVDGGTDIDPPVRPTGDEYRLPEVAAMNGDTFAVVHQETGRVYAQRLDPSGGTSIDGLTDQAPLATIGGYASVAVDHDGDVMAVSAETGRVVEIPVAGDGFGSPQRHDLDFSSPAADITAVGDEWVVLDLESGQIHTEGLEEPQPLPEGADTEGDSVITAALQQPGPADEVVAVQTMGQASFVRIEDDGDHEDRAAITSGVDPDPEAERARYNKISPPVVSGDCLYAAWGRGSAIHWARACGEDRVTASQIRNQGDVERFSGVTVRYNRGQVVLNDLDTGRVFDLTLDGILRIDTWPGGAPRAEPRRYTPPHAQEPSTSDTSSTTSTTSTG